MKANEIIKDVLRRVADYYGMPPAEITARRRCEPRATVRGVTMLLLVETGVNRRAALSALNISSQDSYLKLQARTILSRAETDAALAADVAALRAGGGRREENFVTVYRARQTAQLAARRRRNNPGCRVEKTRVRQRVLEVKQEWDGQPVAEFKRDERWPGFGSLAVLESKLVSA